MPPTRHPNPAAVLALGASLLATVVTAQAAAPASCEARSGARVPAVVELYTSEGCSSCPPADRWLSTLKAGPEVIPLAFHVDYWDQLGWPDRLAQPAFSARQRDWQAVQHTRFVYTPQTILNGEDWRGWPGTPPAARPASASAPVLRLLRQGNQVTASVEPGAISAGSSPARRPADGLLGAGRRRPPQRGARRGKFRPQPAARPRGGGPAAPASLAGRLGPALDLDAAHPR